MSSFSVLVDIHISGDLILEMILCFFRLRSTGHCFASSFSLQNMMMQMDAIDDVF